MKRFIAFYFLFLVMLFALFYAESNVVSTYLNEAQTTLTLTLLHPFLDPGQLQGIDIWINPHYKIIINKACNGMIPILLLFASILAYPSTIGHKIVWIFVGYLLFSLVNVARILLVVFFTEQEGGQGNFYWSHDILGNIVLMMTGLGLFISFIKTSSRTLKDV